MARWWRRQEPDAPRPPRTVPRLSPEGERELARVVEVLAAHGVYAPRAAEPAQLAGPVADLGAPVLAGTVLAALDEAEFSAPGFRWSDHTSNLAFHQSHGEQLPDTLREQVDDLVRLTGAGLAGVAVAVEVGWGAPGPRVPTTIRLSGAVDDRVIVYAGAAKYLSTVLHVALARIARERGTGRRLAWLWSDQGVWITGLDDGDVERLDAALGPAAGDGFAWVDEQPPTAAGEMYPGR